MKIAVLADIHSNHIALERCLEEAKALGAAEYIFLGDYVGDLACPERTLAVLEALRKESPCTFIRGNKEDYWINHINGIDEGWAWETGITSSGMLQYSYEHLKEEQVRWFETLPIARKVEYEGLPPFVICHGSPFKVNQSLREDYDYIDELTGKLETELTICAHFHIQAQYVRNGKRVVNPGSVGMPLKTGGKTQFMILEGKDGGWETRFHTIAYDAEAAVREMDEEDLSRIAPGWYRISKAVILGKDLSHMPVLVKAHDLCLAAEGECDWHRIPEKYWEMALEAFGI